jgi:hypothetical protein
VHLARQDASFGNTELRWPDFSPTVNVADGKVVLLVDGLYWGTRRLIETLTRDNVRMNQFDLFINSPKMVGPLDS